MPEGTRREEGLILSGAILEGLQRVRGEARFRQWHGLVEGLPTLLWAQKGFEAPILINRHSPLAVEALFEGFAVGRGPLRLEAMRADPFLTDKAGHHYLSDIVAPALDEEHPWLHWQRA